MEPFLSSLCQDGHSVVFTKERIRVQLGNLVKLWKDYELVDESLLCIRAKDGYICGLEVKPMDVDESYKTAQKRKLREIEVDISELDRSINELTDRKRVKVQERNRLKRILNSIEDNGIDCHICLDTTPESFFLYGPKCGHKFHKTCLRTYIKAREEWSCPLCRTSYKGRL